MQTWKTLAVAAGMTMAAGSALAHRAVDADELLGTWQAQIEGEEGAGTVRVVFTEDGHYIALAMIDGEQSDDEPVQFWETGTWKLRGSTLTCEATGSSEEMSDEDMHTVLKIEDIDDESVHFTSESDPMWDELDFSRVLPTQFAGVWEAESDEGEICFVFADDGGEGGQFAGHIGDGEDLVWGHWEMDGDDAVTFFVTEDEWTVESAEDAAFDEYAGEVEEMDDDAMSLVIEGLGDDAIEFERVTSDPLVGEWTGHIEGSDVTFTLDDDGTFSVASPQEQMEISGQWAHLGGSMIFLAMDFGGSVNTTVLHYRLTSGATVMFGEHMDDMESFTRE